MVKLGLLFRKQEMTRLWVDEKLMPVTLLRLVPQQIIRKKTKDSDGYSALVVGAEKKELDKEKGIKEKYSHICEYKVDEEDLDSYQVGDFLDLSVLEDIQSVNIYGVSKGKGFQGAIKRHGFSRGPETHGSHFHRSPGSVGGMKPRRVIKGKKLPGRMGRDSIKLKNVPLVDKIALDEESLVAVKGSVPGAYNDLVKAK
ncbi:50S ribosomal protein L3 [Candidatus Absconditicoccus praedator]|uniref:50S ribosomal protein L3 n=1 Tax=Candidatus Absconditicoccus praedator TaxID=2735562 RepID=UPI001E5623AE|nr:50S ribosomal protein L3 [Candidatus Absconditicoccus praedator]UFX82788.1 50S ribosomal protein L3 [Candidatus Absconditicoccus praedator]